MFWKRRQRKKWGRRKSWEVTVILPDRQYMPKGQSRMVGEEEMDTRHLGPRNDSDFVDLRE